MYVTLKKSRSGYVLLMVVFIMLFLSILLGIGFMRSDSQLRFTQSREDTQQAFYAADSGIDRTLYELRLNIQWKPGVGGIPPVIDERLNLVPLDNTTTVGFYSLQVVDGVTIPGFGETRWVRSVGKNALTDVSRVICARMLVNNPARFMLATPGELWLKSGAVINSDILGRRIKFILPGTGGDINVNGDVFYLQDVGPSGWNTDTRIHVTGTVGMYPQITYPGVDMGRYRLIASDPTIAYKKTSSFTVDLGNLDALTGRVGFKPLILFSEGDITISGEFSHSLIVVAGGNINIVGNIKAAPGHRGDKKFVGLFANQDVIIPDTMAADSDLYIKETFIMADGDGASYGEFRAESPNNELDTLDFSGAISVRGERPNKPGMDLAAFRARNYTAIDDLVVPFSPYIANVISWQETALTDTCP